MYFASRRFCAEHADMPSFARWILRMRPRPTQPNRALLLTNAEDFGSDRCAVAFYLSVRSRTPTR